MGFFDYARFRLRRDSARISACLSRTVCYLRAESHELPELLRTRQLDCVAHELIAVPPSRVDAWCAECQHPISCFGNYHIEYFNGPIHAVGSLSLLGACSFQPFFPRRLVRRICSTSQFRTPVNPPELDNRKRLDLGFNDYFQGPGHRTLYNRPLGIP